MGSVRPHGSDPDPPSIEDATAVSRPRRWHARTRHEPPCPARLERRDVDVVTKAYVDEHRPIRGQLWGAGLHDCDRFAVASDDASDLVACVVDEPATVRRPTWEVVGASER